MDIFFDFETYIFFKDENKTKPPVVSSELVFFHKQNILYINICFRRLAEENLVKLVHVK